MWFLSFIAEIYHQEYVKYAGWQHKQEDRPFEIRQWGKAAVIIIDNG